MIRQCIDCKKVYGCIYKVKDVEVTKSCIYDCGWLKRHTCSNSDMDSETTHGICHPCLKKNLRLLREKRKKKVG